MKSAVMTIALAIAAGACTPTPHDPGRSGKQATPGGAAADIRSSAPDLEREPAALRPAPREPVTRWM